MGLGDLMKSGWYWIAGRYVSRSHEVKKVRPKLTAADRELGDLMAPFGSICKSCGHMGVTRIHKPGSILITLLLLCFFFLPGIIYAIWRGSAAYRICHKCESRDIVPVSSTLGKELIQKRIATYVDKKCPACAETVKSDARICRFCRHEFEIKTG